MEAPFRTASGNRPRVCDVTVVQACRDKLFRAWKNEAPPLGRGPGFRPEATMSSCSNCQASLPREGRSVPSAARLCLWAQVARAGVRRRHRVRFHLRSIQLRQAPQVRGSSPHGVPRPLHPAPRDRCANPPPMACRCLRRCCPACRCLLRLWPAQRRRRRLRRHSHRPLCRSRLHRTRQSRFPNHLVRALRLRCWSP